MRDYGKGESVIQLTEYQMTLCRLFARESAKTQQQIEFGNPDTADVMRLRAGGYLPGTSCRLQADNYAMRREALSDIRASVRYMVGCRNVTADNFKAIAEAIIKRLRKG